jgi:hypothetical protein
MLTQRYILSQDPRFPLVLEFIRSHAIPFEAHLNRTRFTVDSRADYYLEFVLRYLDSCPQVIS